MDLHLSKRNAIRAGSFAAALLLVLGVSTYQNWHRAEIAERHLEYQYLKGIEDLGTYLENIQNTLTKSMYAGTSQTMDSLAAKLRQESGYAKECLGALPVGSLHLEKTYKYLSQVGDYATALSRKVDSGQALTAEEHENLSKMRDYADQFLQNVLVTEDAMRTGTLSFDEVQKEVIETAAEPSEYYLVDGINQVEEETLTDYPTLIYDGPFSDHVLSKKPAMLEGAPEISRLEARKIAANACGVKEEELQDDTDEEGNMPAWCFQTQDKTIAVTKQGGLISYYIDSRNPTQESKSPKECIASAQQFLENLGITSMTYTYYEAKGHALTVNFAHQEGDVTCYTDLVKITVAMDNGQVIRYDGRGYITNHRTRPDLTPAVTESQAAEVLSPLLTVSGAKLAVIPTQDAQEALCYEFDCSSTVGEHVLVYVNALTGAEQQILILYTDENGTLTL